jgi:hypothetical protein
LAEKFEVERQPHFSPMNFFTIFHPARRVIVSIFYDRLLSLKKKIERQTETKKTAMCSLRSGAQVKKKIYL